MDRMETLGQSYDTAYSQIVNRALQPSNVPNTKPLSNLTKVLTSFQLRLEAMNEDTKQLTQSCQQLKSQMKAVAGRLQEQTTTRQKSIVSSMNSRYEQNIKSRIQQCHSRSIMVVNRVEQLSYDYDNTSRQLKKLCQRIDQLENALGFYSAKDKFI